MQAENDKGEHISQPLRYLIRFIQAKHGSAKSMENPWEAIDMQLGIDGWPADREKKCTLWSTMGVRIADFFNFWWWVLNG